MANSMESLKAEIEQEQIEQTRPVPGFERLRFAGNDHKGYWPCNTDGTYIRSGDGVPLHFGCMAHLQMWAFEWCRSAGIDIIFPTGD